MAFFEDFVARYHHTYLKFRGEPVYIYDMIRNSEPRSVSDISFLLTQQTGKAIKVVPDSESEFDFSFPKSSLVNDTIETFWCVRRPERQWKRTVCRTNTRIFSITDFFNIIGVVSKKIDSSVLQGTDITQQVINSVNVCYYKWLNAKDYFLTFNAAKTQVESGLRSSAAFSSHYAIGMVYPDNRIGFYRKNLLIGYIEGKKVSLIYPVIKQEVMDLSKRQNLDLEIV